jgi:IclR family transcriptional regulator, pca regulon regulatory protein
VSPRQGDNGESAARTRGIPSERLSYSLQSGIALLLVFSEERQALGVAEMADLAGLTRPTTHRYARTFVRLGFLEQDSKHRYRLGVHAADPGAAVIQGIRRALPARAVLEELRDKTGHTVSMGALDGTRVVYVHRLFGHRRGQHMIDRELRVGAYIPAYCTALGKVLLASLSDAERCERVATIHLVPQGPRSITVHDKLLEELSGMNLRAPIVSDEEFVIGARSIATLLLWPNGEYPMAIDVTVPSGAYAATQLLNQIGPEVMRAAKLISQA